MKKIKEFFKKELTETKLLLKNIPALTMTLFVVSIVAMNLLASKALVNESWIALDAGIIVSWLSFLTMDMIVKRFGPRASIRLSIVATIVNILVMGIFTAAAFIPGDWCLNDYGTGVNWWIIGASSTAFLVSGVVNSVTNWAIKKIFKKNPDSFAAYAASSYGSTMIGQFVDNLVFALVFTYPASCIGLWGMSQMSVLALFMFAFTGAVVELLCQIIFSPIGFKVANKWKAEKVGQEYIDYVSAQGEEVGDCATPSEKETVDEE